MSELLGPAEGLRAVPHDDAPRTRRHGSGPFEVVAAVARLLGETLELRQVFARVAEAALGAFDFDHMNVLLRVDADSVRHHSVAATGLAGRGAQEGRLVKRDDCSARLWGLGALAFFSRRPHAFAREDEPVVKALADLVAAVHEHEHERLWTIERERSRRVTAPGGLLPTQRPAEEERRDVEARVLAVRLASRVCSLGQQIESPGGRRRVVGESRAWKEVMKLAGQVAATDTTVLLLGESGTGKEVVARLIHGSSPRADGPYVALNCAALPDQLLESELFGYEKGALTADVRVVAATNRDLQAAVEERSFREDLYYRLHVFEICLPPLRERPEDILPLSQQFLAEIASTFARPPAGISRDARELLLQCPWPGNVRQLRNTLERAAILCEGGLIDAEHLSLTGPRVASLALRPTADHGNASMTSVRTAAELQAIERGMVEKALHEGPPQQVRCRQIPGSDPKAALRAPAPVRPRLTGTSWQRPSCAPLLPPSVQP